MNSPDFRWFFSSSDSVELSSRVVVYVSGREELHVQVGLFIFFSFFWSHLPFLPLLSSSRTSLLSRFRHVLLSESERHDGEEKLQPTSCDAPPRTEPSRTEVCSVCFCLAPLHGSLRPERISK